MSTAQEVQKVLQQNKARIGRVMPFNLNQENVVIFDFTTNNNELAKIDLTNTSAFTSHIFNTLLHNNTQVGIGQYNENRTLYGRSSLFNGQGEARTVHLGIDVWAAAGTKVFAPLRGRIHSFAINPTFGDYGATIILEHELNGVRFFTLYGHLSHDSLANLQISQDIERGDEIARLGSEQENGSWPPHLHFQIVTDLQGRKGDFPGVAPMSERETWLELCPDANLILQMNRLKELQEIPHLFSDKKDNHLKDISPLKAHGY